MITHSKIKELSVISICILMVVCILSTGCTRVVVVPPSAIPFVLAPPMLTAEELYDAYKIDTAAADIKFKNKDIWITKARVDTFTESQDGAYISLRWYQPVPTSTASTAAKQPGYCLASVKLDSQKLSDFKDVEAVEVVGECLGMSEGVITLKINRINKTSIAPIQVVSPGW
jgi:hypothetical protein